MSGPLIGEGADVVDTHSHQELLTRANKVRAAAMDRDIDRFRREVDLLLGAFREHVEAQGAGLVALPMAVATTIGRGQKRLLKRLVALSSAATEDEVSTECVDLGVELTTLMTIQTEAERRALGRTDSSLTSVS